MPSWKSSAFYFRRMRKIGLAEGVIYMLVIATGIQYCMNWAAYFERRCASSSSFSSSFSSGSPSPRT